MRYFSNLCISYLSIRVYITTEYSIGENGQNAFDEWSNRSNNIAHTVEFLNFSDELSNDQCVLDPEGKLLFL